MRISSHIPTQTEQAPLDAKLHAGSPAETDAVGSCRRTAKLHTSRLRLYDTLKRAALLWLSGGINSASASALLAPKSSQDLSLLPNWPWPTDAYSLSLGGRAWEIPLRPHPRSLAQARPEKLSLELVIARLDEDITWLDDVPDGWHISVYDQDIDNTWGLPKRPITRLSLVGGQQSHTFAHHIEQHYESLADFTAFAPGDALVHTPKYIDLLSRPDSLEAVQVMSLLNADMLPPPAFLRRNEVDLVVRPERISLRTLDSIFYRDTQHLAASSYRSYYRLLEGANLLAHFLTNIGLPGWVSEGQDLGTIAHAGMFGARRDQILQHPLHVYQSLRLKDFESPVIGEIANKAWLIMLGGPGYREAVSPLGRRHARPNTIESAALRQ